MDGVTKLQALGRVEEIEGPAQLGVAALVNLHQRVDLPTSPRCVGAITGAPPPLVDDFLERLDAGLSPGAPVPEG